MSGRYEARPEAGSGVRKASLVRKRKKGRKTRKEKGKTRELEELISCPQIIPPQCQRNILSETVTRENSSITIYFFF